MCEERRWDIGERERREGWEKPWGEGEGREGRRARSTVEGKERGVARERTRGLDSSFLRSRGYERSSERVFPVEIVFKETSREKIVVKKSSSSRKTWSRLPRQLQLPISRPTSLSGSRDHSSHSQSDGIQEIKDLQSERVQMSERKERRRSRLAHPSIPSFLDLQPKDERQSRAQREEVKIEL